MPGLYCLDIGNEIMPTIISWPFIFIITKGGPAYYGRNGVGLGSYSLLKSYWNSRYRHFKNGLNAKILSSPQKLLSIIFRH